jgi:amino acid permease
MTSASSSSLRVELRYTADATDHSPSTTTPFYHTGESVAESDDGLEDYVLDDHDYDYSDAYADGEEHNLLHINAAEHMLLPVDAFSSQRQGTVMSATINLLTSMVGGGSLSLPFAFAKAGNVALAPLLLLFCAGSAGFTLKALMDSAARVSHMVAASAGAGGPANKTGPPSRMTYDKVALYAFGPRAQYLSMIMVVGVCFVGVIGYSVLLRDLGVPLAHAITGHDASDPSSDRPTLVENAIMFAVVLLVSPLTTLKTLTALKSVGTLSILSVLILGICVVYRSSQCVAFEYDATNETLSTASTSRFLQDMTNATTTTSAHLGEAPYVHPHHTFITLSYMPESWREFLNAFPLILNCFFCQFNAIPVHAELSHPTSKRTSRVSKAVVICAFLFYIIVGFFGSIFGKCTTKGHVSDNILLDFDDDDPVVTVARVCLAVVISFAFPLQVMPARDTLLRLWEDLQERKQHKKRRANDALTAAIASDNNNDHPENNNFNNLAQPLLMMSPQNDTQGVCGDDDSSTVDENGSISDDINFVSMYEQPTPPDFEATSKMEEEMDLAYQYTRSNAVNATGVNNTVPGSRGGRGRRYKYCCDTTGNGCLPSTKRRVFVALGIFWTAAAIASTVSSIAVVWDFLGSTLVIMVGFILPSAMYLKLCSGSTEVKSSPLYTIAAWGIIVIYAPLMVLCTANAVCNAFE